MITTIVPLLNVAIIVFNVAIIVHHTVIINLSFASGASLRAKHLIHSTDHLDNVDHDEEEEEVEGGGIDCFLTRFISANSIEPLPSTSYL